MTSTCRVRSIRTRRGRGAPALATAAIGSFVAASVATVGLTLLAPILARWAVTLGSPDYFALMMVAFLTVGAMLGSSVARGMVSLALGLFLGLVGTEVLTGQQWYTLGMPVLADGIDVVLIGVGLFAVGESLYVASRLKRGAITVIPVSRGWRNWMSREDWSLSWRPWLRGTAIGFPIGTIPAGGADVATFLSYATEKRLAKRTRRAEFGKGAIEGVAGPEAANNAAAAGVLVPLLTLGLPTSATAAIILSAFQSYGIQPGPLLFENQSALVWALIASLYIGNLMLLALNLPLVGMWVKVLQIPRPYLYSGILMFAALGAFAMNFNPLDVVILLVIGIVGFVMRRYGYPVAPMVVGGILGPIAETQLRKTLAISQGDLTALVTSPFAASAYLALIVLIGLALWLRRRKARMEQLLVAPSEPEPALDRPRSGEGEA